MSIVLISEAAPGTDEWHAVRANGIGASEIAAVVGLSPWESPFSLWHRKKGNLPPQPHSDLFYWGHALEPLVAKRFDELHPEWLVRECATYANEDRPWQFANLDRALIGNGGQESLLEIKTTRYGDGWGPAGTDEIPLHVRCQVMHQMDVFGYTFAWVAVLIGGSDYREYRIEFDEAEAAVLRDAGEAFWQSIQNDDEPPIDVTDATYQAIRALHPDIDADADVELDPALYIEYATTKAAADATADDHRKVKSEVLHVMGNARRALVDGSPVLRRQPTRNGATALYAIKEK